MHSRISEALRGYELVDLSHMLDDEVPAAYRMYNRITWMTASICDRFNAAMLLVFEHAGTHVDAPTHLASVSGPTIEETPLEQWMGDCCVIRIRGVEHDGLVKVSDIQLWERENGQIGEGDFVLFDFGWPSGWTPAANSEGMYGYKRNPGLSEEAAKYLVSKSIGLVGCDVPSIDSYLDEQSVAHRVILENKVALLETLSNLDKVPPKGAFLIAFPLRIKGGSGSPVRAVAFVPRDR
jgi:kynurenine formamidase